MPNPNKTTENFVEALTELIDKIAAKQNEMDQKLDHLIRRRHDDGDFLFLLPDHGERWPE